MALVSGFHHLTLSTQGAQADFDVHTNPRPGARAQGFRFETCDAGWMTLPPGGPCRG